MAPKRAINYARVSTPRQAELYSLDYQLDEMRLYDADVGLVVVAEFKEDKSGRKIDRDYLEEACQILERGEADVLVTWKFDRLHRNYVNSVVLRDRLRRAGKEIHYAQTRTVSGKTARQRLPEDIQYIMAEIEADDILERTSGGRRRKIEQGQKWSGANKPPYGYKAVGHGQEAKMVVDEWEELLKPEQAEELLDRIRNGEVIPEALEAVRQGRATPVVVRWVFAWYVYGDGESGPLSTQKVAKKLTALGLPTPADIVPERAHLKKRAYGQWGWESVHRLLREDAYNGTFYHYRRKIVNGKLTRNLNKEEWRGVPVPSIVEKDLFEAAQRKLSEGRKISSRGVRYEYLVGRRITCECGYTMRSTTTPRTFHRQKGTTTTYYYGNYRCPGRHSMRVNSACTMKPIKVSAVDERTWEWVKEEVANPVILERKLREIQSEQRDKNSGKAEIAASLERSKGSIEEELKRLATLYAKRAMPEHILDELIGQENHKLQLTIAEIERVSTELMTPLTDETIDSLVAFSTDFAEHLEAVEQTFTGRRTVIDGLDVRVQVVRVNDVLHLRLKSVLRPDGVLRTLFASP